MAERAEHIWRGGTIETMVPGAGRAEAVAVAGGRVIAAGREADVMNLSGPGTKLHDLHGRYMMPGLVESHTHALWGGRRDLYELFVGYRASLDQLVEAVKARAAETSPDQLILGGPWRYDMREAMGARPVDILDAAAPDHVVMLADASQHSLWVNSRAMAAAGVGADVPGGVVERDAAGKPSGLFHENATGPLRALAEYTDAQQDRAADYFVEYFNRLGFTAFKEPMAYEPDLRAYRDADREGRLTLHAASHIVRMSPFAPDGVPYEEMERLRDVYASPNHRTGYAKLFLDGVAPSHTASFFEPYLAETGYDVAGHDPDATLLIPRDRLADEVAELDRRGFVVKMHAVGDNAANAALDAIEAARARNGQSGLRHETAHSGFIRADDLPRYAALGAVLEISPKIWFPNPVTPAQLAHLGRERVERAYALRDYLAAGAEVTYASDWPAAAPDPNPWIGLAGMISRRDPTGVFEGTLGADQALTLDEALPFFTRNGARTLDMAGETGVIAAGAYADFCVLDRPLDQMTPEEIGAIEVAETWWKGDRVYARG